MKVTTDNKVSVRLCLWKLLNHAILKKTKQKTNFCHWICKLFHTQCRYCHHQRCLNPLGHCAWGVCFLFIFHTHFFPYFLTPFPVYSSALSFQVIVSLAYLWEFLAFFVFILGVFPDLGKERRAGDIPTPSSHYLSDCLLCGFQFGKMLSPNLNSGNYYFRLYKSRH